jgi:hypothetical protein
MKSLVVRWRDAVRDSDLSLAHKAVAYTLSTYSNGSGIAFPSRERIARGASCGVRTVDAAVHEIEVRGFVEVEHSNGRTSNLYTLILPTAQEVHGYACSPERSTAHDVPRNGATDDANRATDNADRATPAPEVVEVVDVKAALSALDKLEDTPAARILRNGLSENSTVHDLYEGIEAAPD